MGARGTRGQGRGNQPTATTVQWRDGSPDSRHTSAQARTRRL